ncbi:MAG: HemK2/MTQ2 family protein methyltransferase [Candidatus Hodarchaeota archaeon]
MTSAGAFFEDVWVIVKDGVYQPADDTFLLCAHLDVSPDDLVLEVGTGCGLVAIVAAKAGAKVVATDQSVLAVENARENISLHNLDFQIEVRQGSYFEPIRPNEKFSLIAFNPPYLPSTDQDPAFDLAWSGGVTGREVSNTFLTQSPNYLTKDGRLLLVHSSLANSQRTQAHLEKLFYHVCVKAEKALFFERLLLFEAKDPI